LVLPLAFRVRIAGRENFPKRGPLIVVGNHVAVMEAVLMTVYSPWQVEILGAGDIPHERISEFSMRYFGFIPVNRGHFDRGALTKALGVLEQDGVIGIFPEGGVWEAGAMRPQTGVAWLSYRAGAPVVPIGFSGMYGALGEAMQLKRPQITMSVGQPIPAAQLPEDMARKPYLEAYATRVIDAVRDLLPEEERVPPRQIVDELFELKLEIRTPGGDAQPVPEELSIRHPDALAKFFHQPVILKIFRLNLDLPIDALQHLVRVHDAAAIAAALELVLRYLEDENPYLLTYRFGPQEAEAMQLGLEELLPLAHWAAESGCELKITPIRRFYSPEQDKEIVQIEQGDFAHWM
jgi:1-acyl-sn-glycerol-3-phosphate acyltransferase